MNKTKAIMTALTLFAMVLVIASVYADKPLERLGNETAADADALYAEGKLVEAAKKYEEAYDFFVKAQEEDDIPLQDKIQQMLQNMLTAYYQGKDFSNAVKTLKLRLENDPTSDVCARQISQIYEKDLKDIKNAISVLEEFDPVNPNFNVRRTLGRLYTTQNNEQKSLEWYLKAFELRKDADVLQNIALLYYRTNEVEKAIKAYEDFLAADPPQNVLIAVYRNMGKFYEEAGNDKKSIEYYEKTNKLRFNKDITLLLLTKYYDRGDLLNADIKVKQLLENKVNEAAATFYKALIHYDKQDFEKARAEFEKVTSDRVYGVNAKQYIESIDSM
ncbi:MAG: tetratricopeptide repeat protein [Candidatus Cloacimonas sp.]|nr:tetratricopeptide repeat protein [Candidatus Cloacimonadota bacterium]